MRGATSPESSAGAFGRIASLRSHWVFPSNFQWSGWKLADAQNQIMRSSKRYAYSHVHAPTFFRWHHPRLSNDAHVSLRLGCRVEQIEQGQSGRHRIETNQGVIEADEVIDARHEGAAAYRGTVTNASLLVWQSFLGRVVESAAPCFDPDAVTLMDFRVPVSHGLAFAYLLPFTATRALVEIAVLASRPTEPAFLAALDRYLAERIEKSMEVLGTETGVLPMTPDTFDVVPPSGMISVGAGGGSIRPSSGYAFGRILRSTATLAAALCRGHPDSQPSTVCWTACFCVFCAMILRPRDARSWRCSPKCHRIV